MVIRRYISRALIPVIALVGITAVSSCMPAGWDKFPAAVSADGLARLRQCESGGNYGSIGGGGAFRGAYQFTQSTWNATAARFYPELRGVDPARAHPLDQDRMARALWATGGPRNWPVCSRRV